MTRQAQTPPPPALPVPADAGLAELQAQLQQLQVVQSGLQAQWDGLKDQLDNMLRSNPARPRVQQQWADVGMQKAQVDGSIAALKARIAAKQGLPITPPAVPNMPVFPRVTPNVVVPAISVVTLVLLFPISVAWAKRILRRAPKAVAVIPTEVTTRLERIEQAVDTIAIEVERISEGQRFVTKVMAGRPAAGASNDAASADRSAIPANQPLALGAGAIEQIVVADRDRVRQRVITPH